MNKKSLLQKTLILFGPTLFLLCFNLAFFNRYFPVTEGWWETYAYLCEKGLVPYKDFYMAFPPLFVYINVLLLKITHHFFALRLIGVCVFLGNVLLTQRLLANFFSPKVAAIATLFASLLLMSDTMFIAKDYHTYENTFILLTLLATQQFAASLLDNRHFAKSLLWISISAVCSGLLILVKQNDGIFLSFANLISLMLVPGSLLVARPLLKKVTLMSCYMMGLIFIISCAIGYFYLHDAGVSFIKSVFLANNAKGGVLTILSRFFEDTTNQFFFLSTIPLVLIFFLIDRYTRTYQHDTAQAIAFIKNHEKIGLMPLVLLQIYFFYTANWILSAFVIIFPLSVVLFLFSKSFLFGKRDTRTLQRDFFLLSLMTLVYCNTQSSSLSHTGMYLIEGFGIAYLVSILHEHLHIALKYLLLFLLLFSFYIVREKLHEPYAWWGYTQSSTIKSAHNIIPYEDAKGIYVDERTASLYQVVHNTVTKYSRSDSDVYFFPDIPIFYFLHHKIPPYKGVIQWFDVISSADIQEEFKRLNANPPRVIVFFDPPPFVYEGHAGLTHKILMQNEFKKLFDEWASAGKYKKIAYLLDRHELIKNDHLTNDEHQFILKMYIKNGHS